MGVPEGALAPPAQDFADCWLSACRSPRRPVTPGFVADTGLALQLAEIGVILLMFGVGFHFSLKTCCLYARSRCPGLSRRLAVATALGMMLGLWLGGRSRQRGVRARAVGREHRGAARACRRATWSRPKRDG